MLVVLAVLVVVYLLGAGWTFVRSGGAAVNWLWPVQAAKVVVGLVILLACKSWR